ncbi:hypothetical protein MMC30_005701 [Trapelia coarctata]|nr:hypothetical protein [Trapelia coarctata]
MASSSNGPAGHPQPPTKTQPDGKDRELNAIFWDPVKHKMTTPKLADVIDDPQYVEIELPKSKLETKVKILHNNHKKTTTIARLS